MVAWGNFDFFQYSSEDWESNRNGKSGIIANLEKRSITPVPPPGRREGARHGTETH